MDTAHMAIALGNHHWTQQHQANVVVHPITGKEMEYTDLTKDTHLQSLCKRGFGHECGCLFQGIRDIPGTDTCLFINVPMSQKIERSLTEKWFAITNPTKKKKNESGYPSVATG
jgi:hypothetical protein